ALWNDQVAVVRETTLIPTPVALDRSQTLRFGLPLVTREGSKQPSRLCVSEGFMCGFDLQMPSRPFPAKDAAICPLAAIDPVPAALYYLIGMPTGPSGPQQLFTVLGCETQLSGETHGWLVWKFDRGVLAMASRDPPGKERVLAAWVIGEPGK